MACSCKNKRTTKFVWTDGVNTVVYSTEIQAKAKVIRAGGTYSKQE